MISYLLFRIHVLSALYHHGWYLLTATDISKKEHDKDSLIFQLGVPPPPTSFFAISFNELDKLRLICAPHELNSAVQRTLGPANIQGEEWRDNGLAYQFKLYDKFVNFFKLHHFSFVDVAIHGIVVDQKESILECNYSLYSIVLLHLAGNYIQASI